MTGKRSAEGSVFERLADFMSYAIGRPGAFITAVVAVAVWAALGPAADFSNTWQLVINTGTTIVTFLMVFLLGNASNRITDSQDTMLDRIYSEQQRTAAEERLIEKLLARIDVKHVRPILQHLDDQDHKLEETTRQILEALRAEGKEA